MSIRITGNGIESDGNMKIESLSGDISMVDTVLDSPKKATTIMGNGKVAVIGSDEEVLCSKLHMTGDASLTVTGSGRLRMV